MKFSKTKAIIFVGIVCIMSVVFLYWFIFAPSYRYAQTSPNGQFTIEIYEEPKRLFTAPGDGSYRDAKLVLKNKYGFEVASSPSDAHFGFPFCENGVFEWDYKNNAGDSFVWYVCGNSRAGFNLKTKKFEY